MAICPLGGAAPAEIADLLDRRKIATQIATLADAGSAEVGAIAAVAGSSLTPDQAARLSPLCRKAALAGRPVILLAPPSRFRDSITRAMIAAHLESAGALMFADPDSWLEAVVLIAAFGLPAGPSIAVVSPEGGWLEAAAESLALEHASGRVRAQSAIDVASLAPTDIALCDYREMPASTALERVLVVPLCPRGEVVGELTSPVLVGLRAALDAAQGAGRLARRLGDRDGGEIAGAIDWDRVDRQLDKLERRAGDHETKVMLAAAGVAITRQAVATTASAATRLAKRAGYPAQMKPWGPDVADERSGCPVEVDLETAADVRRAYARLAGESGAAIVRETPPRGRELTLRIDRHKQLGPMAVVAIAGQERPLAAAAPITALDAERIADAVVATRAGEAEPDRASLADLLRRVSILFCERPRLSTLALPRIVAGSREALAVDAWSALL